MVGIFLGAKWMAAAPIFRLLAPVAVVFAIANPLSWLVSSTGQMGRALSISATMTPAVILGIVLGLSHGPQGVAMGYSSAMTLVLIPIAAWSKLGTAVTWKNLWRATKAPLFSGLVAGVAGLLVKFALGGRVPLILCLLVGVGLVLVVYAWILLIVMNQSRIYIDLLSHLLPRLELGQEKESMTNTGTLDQILAKAVGWQIFGRSPASLYLRLNEWIWNRLPSHARDLHLVRAYGGWLHTLVCLRSTRRQYHGTYFLRNRPALELIRRLCEQKARGATVRIAVLGCSIGAEVYSIRWTLSSARTDLRIILHAVDISEEVLSFAKRGIYDPDTCEFVGASIFERLTSQEKQEMFDWEGNRATVKAWLREGIIWKLGDATDPEMINVLGLQDIVVGSNFLCHMAPADAEKCLRNMVRLLEPDSYLFVSGVDLGVRTKVALDLGWKPVPHLMADIHDGDRSVRADWPWRWWGLEPLNQRRRDWRTRYAAVFQVGG
jgi:SAM-dependent methyltransferase